MKAFFAWMKQWARTGYEAVTRVAFYRRLEARKTGEAAGHLAMFAVLWTLPLSVMFFIGLRQVSNRLAEGLRSGIPAGSVFEMKDGTLTSNLREPLRFSEGTAIVVLDAATATSALPPYAEGAIDTIVIGSDGITERTGDHDARFTSFKNAPNFKVSREELMEKIARWAPLTLFIGSLLTLVVMFLAFWGGFLLNALLHGFTLWLLLKVIKRPRPWRESFVAAAYAATAPIVLNLALSGFERFRAVPDIAYWAFIAWIAYDAYKGGTHERKETAAIDRPHAEGESKPV